MAERSAPTDGPVGPDPRRRSERARRAVLTAAAELLGEVGFAKMTVEAIAARAGVGKQTIYRWWPSKAGVLLDVFTELTGSGSEERLPDTGDLAADLKAVLRATVDEFNDPVIDRTARAFTAEIQHDSAFAEAVREQQLRPGLEAYKARLRSAQEAGEIDPGLDLDIAVELLTGPFHQRWLQRTAPLTHGYVDALVDTALRGMRPPG
ncbi:TetR/AcrR family transcriptional regulator [Nocardiopsis algeriensis]|uniref:AcrR family transcriptional regulator n=1 Tax=Nocardiopsis algeriensis TaxID=1478215 RepID=A0A841IZ06_9ACTN|nr:TetR/AcrR family transcriptional regulator [Nocardiopsis algeriensis]MBB6121685.1 AcrR family transcriptional regulator [Nocardiopsis algeriensis]